MLELWECCDAQLETFLRKVLNGLRVCGWIERQREFAMRCERRMTMENLNRNFNSAFGGVSAAHRPAMDLADSLTVAKCRIMLLNYERIQITPAL